MGTEGPGAFFKGRNALGTENIMLKCIKSHQKVFPDVLYLFLAFKSLASARLTGLLSPGLYGTSRGQNVVLLVFM